MAISDGIVINGRFLTQRLTGVQRFAGETLLAIDALLERPEFSTIRDKVEVLVPRGQCRSLPFKNISTRVCGRLQGYFWEQMDLPRFVGGRVLFSPCAVGPLYYDRQVLVVHDTTFMVVPETFSLPVRLLYRALVPRLIRSVRRLAAVSEFTKSEMVRWFGTKPDDIIVCGEGSDHIERLSADPTVLARNGLVGKRFLLVVGLGGRNKNLSTVLDAFRAAKLGDVQLVLVGKRDAWVHGESAEAEAESVHSVGRVEDSELKTLYENALALIYPSLYEGFGLPPVEAMSCGCPVVGTDQPALVEVAAGAALHYPMDGPGALPGLLQRICSDEALRADLSRRGRERALHYRWANTAQVLLTACVQLIDEGRHQAGGRV